MASVSAMPLRTIARAVGLPVEMARKIYEASTPTTQCNNIIGKFKPGTECYICGMEIHGHPKNTNDDAMSGGTKGKKATTIAKHFGRSSRKRPYQSQGVRKIKISSRAKSAKGKSKRGGQRNGKDPECEHILPIAQAVMLLGLYGETTKTHFLYNKELVKIEYRWAHRTCNQVKSDDSYVSYDSTKSVGLQYEINKQ